MSKHSSDDSDEERPTSQASDLTDSELGGGLSLDARVGTSNPIPYPPREKGALSAGPSSTVNQGLLMPSIKARVRPHPQGSIIRRRPSTLYYQPLLSPTVVPGKIKIYMSNMGRGLVQLAPNVGR